MEQKPTKILQIIPTTGYGGISSMLMNLYREIDTKTMQFDFAAFNEGPLHEEILERGGKIFYFDYIKAQGPISYIKKLSIIIQENGPYDAIHVHSGFKGGFALLASRLQKIPIRICHIHTKNVEQKWQKILLPVLKQLAILNSTKLLACGEEAGRFMYNSRDFDVLSNAIQVENYANPNPIQVQKLKSEFFIREDCIVIGHVGRFTEVKNHTFIIEIAEKLKVRNKNFKVLLVGDGPKKEFLLQVVKEKGLSSNFIFAGSRSNIAEIMKLFNIYLFPSLFEGVPLSLLEAQASGIQCLVSTGVPKEADLDAGLVNFIPLSDGAEEWTNQLLDVITREKSNGEIARKNLLSHGFDISNNIKKLSEIYDSN